MVLIFMPWASLQKRGLLVTHVVEQSFLRFELHVNFIYIPPFSKARVLNPPSVAHCWSAAPWQPCHSRTGVRDWRPESCCPRPWSGTVAGLCMSTSPQPHCELGICGSVAGLHMPSLLGPWSKWGTSSPATGPPGSALVQPSRSLTNFFPTVLAHDPQRVEDHCSKGLMPVY